MYLSNLLDGRFLLTSHPHLRSLRSTEWILSTGGNLNGHFWGHTPQPEFTPNPEHLLPALVLATWFQLCAWLRKKGGSLSLLAVAPNHEAGRPRYPTKLERKETIKFRNGATKNKKWNCRGNALLQYSLWKQVPPPIKIRISVRGRILILLVTVLHWRYERQGSDGISEISKANKKMELQ